MSVENLAPSEKQTTSSPPEEKKDWVIDGYTSEQDETYLTRLVNSQVLEKILPFLYEELKKYLSLEGKYTKYSPYYRRVVIDLETIFREELKLPNFDFNADFVYLLRGKFSGAIINNNQTDGWVLVPQKGS